MEGIPQHETTPEWKKLENHQFNEQNFYRIVNKAGYNDYLENGILRSSPTGTEDRFVGSINIGGRPTSFPSFNKGKPDLTYLKVGEENYIFETDTTLFARGDINPATQEEIRGRHWAYRMIDPVTGKNLTELSKDHVKNIYRIDVDGSLYIKGL